MKVRCRLGLHQWEAETRIVARANNGNGNGLPYRVAVTRNRCQRAGCRYDHWMILHVEPASPARGR